ncbi:MAG: hypothetical protein ACOYM3_27025 [Terrimicrobiaceae bacterium]
MIPFHDCFFVRVLIKYRIDRLFLALNSILYQGAAMVVNSPTIQKLSSAFEKQPCWKIEPLATELEYSVPSVRRFLRAIGYYSSYTHNGVWYTLSSIPRFNSDGLWFYSDIGFSRSGTMMNTLVALVRKSPKGMTAKELGEKLHCHCHDMLFDLVRKGRLQRWKVERSHIYIAQDADIVTLQRKAATVPEFQLPAEIAVLVMVEFINNLGFSFAQLAQALSKSKKVTISASQIEILFNRLGVKKTPPM